MKSIVKSIGTIAIAFLMSSNTVLACDCGSKSRHSGYKPYQKGLDNSYYSELSSYYSRYAAIASSKGLDPREVDYFYKKAGKAQKRQVSVEPASSKSQDYNALKNARALLVKNTNKRTMGMYPTQLAAAHFYYDCWASSYKFGGDHLNCMKKFYKHINVVVNDEAAYSDDLSINQSKRLEKYFDKSHLVGVMYFPFDNYTRVLNTDKEAIVQDAAIKAGKDYELIVVGYADKVGTKNYNIDLSVHRAKTVKALLNKRGVRVEGVDVVAFGESKVSPDYGVTTYDDSANRRVEIYAVKKGTTGCGR